METGTVNSFPSHTPPSNLDFAAAGFLPINSGGAVYLVDPHLRTPYVYQYNLSLQREMLNNLVLELNYVGSSDAPANFAAGHQPFHPGDDRPYFEPYLRQQLLRGRDGNSTSGADPGAFCSYATLPEFKNVSQSNYNSLQASLTRQIADSRYIGRTYFVLGYTWSHGIDNASGFRERNSGVPTYNPGLFRASSDQDVRNRITFSGGWDMPWDKAWESGPRRLTQGWSLFPIVTWHGGFPYDMFARLGDRFNPGAEGPSGAGDPYNVHANIVGPTQYAQSPQAPDLGASVGDSPGYLLGQPDQL